MPPKKENRPKSSQQDTKWTFLSNHAHVVLCIAQNVDIRLREVAQIVGITERAVQRIVSELEAAGYLSRSREGRRNRYALNLELPLNHSLTSQYRLKALIELFADSEQAPTKSRRSSSRTASGQRRRKPPKRSR